jgi:ankyrin repeat protein
MDPQGMTPLLHAAARSGDGLSALLLDQERGADRGARSRSTPLMAAALSGDSALIERLLGVGASIRARDRGDSRRCTTLRALDVAVALLLARGADPGARSSSRQTPSRSRARPGTATSPLLAPPRLARPH